MKAIIKVTFVAVLLLNTQVLKAQEDALIILPHGNVGIGTPTPTSPLEVNGTIKAQNLILSNALTAKTGNFVGNIQGQNLTLGSAVTAKTGNFENGVKASTGDFTGNVTMNNAFAGDVGHGFKWASFSHKNAASKNSFGFIHHKDGIKTFMNIKSGDGYIGFQVDNYDKMVLLPSGNVGIGTNNPKTTLDVNGNIVAKTVNGEKPPMIFTVGDKSITNKWKAVNKDVKSLCGDADGCTMKIFLQVVSNRDEVRTITEQIYIEQTDKSNNKQAGLHGWTRQMGGGDKSFVLDTTARHDIIPHPWDWIYVRNYGSSKVGTTTAAYKGYNLQFMVRPGVNATVIIYDR